MLSDTHGHQAGDRVLQDLARIIGRNTRKTDLAARIGGEEYGLLMPGVDLSEATDTARRIQSAVGGHRFDLGGGLAVSLTGSIGVCAMAECLCRVDQDKLYHYADQALYHSKHHGRNGISVFHADIRAICKCA